MAEHRVSLLRSALRRHVDPAHSRDPRVQAVVGALGRLPIAPPPDPAFRAELRAQLVAIAPRIVAESAPAPATTTAQGAQVAETAPAERTRRLSLGRPLAVTASLVTVLALLLGGAVWMSRKALPGDNLYGLKRAGESLQLATAGSDRERARDYLDFAATRVAEARDLLARVTATARGAAPTAGGRVSTHTASLITDTLKSGDGDVTAAARLLNGEAVRKTSTAPLATMNSWAPAQETRLHALALALPAGAVRARADSSAALVAAALARSRALGATVHCLCLQGGRTDKLGPVPCSPCSKPAVTTGPSGPVQGGTATGTANRNAPGGGATGSGTGRPATNPAGNAPRRTTRPGGGLETTPGVPKLPIKLPVPTKPSVPGLRVGTCGVSASVGGVGVGLGLCTPGVHVPLPH